MRNCKKIKDISGQKFNKLTAIRIVSHKPVKWECKCECGNTHIVSTSNLVTGAVKSCGCMHHGKIKHNQSFTRLYRIYAKMKRRCYVKDDVAYAKYGGRGIYICDEWLNSFDAFSKWAYENGYEDSLSIRRFTFEGKTQTLSQWCAEKNMNYGTVWWRLKQGMSFGEAITKPIISERSKC